MSNLRHRKATITDLASVIALLLDDDLGQKREVSDTKIDKRYVDAFNRIDADKNQYLMVVISNDEIVGTCHLTLMPSLTFMGSTRLQIEAVRVSSIHRGKKIGDWMINAAFKFAKSNGASIIQLTTNKLRPQALKFYERLGFKATHEGMKYYIEDNQPRNI